MRWGLISVLAVLIGALVASGTVGAVPVCSLGSCPGSPTLMPTFSAGVLPGRLPRNNYAPVAANLSGKIAMGDGSHPSALREAVVDIDRDVRVNAKGYPTCPAGPHHDTRNDGGIASVERTCPGAIVGRGSARIEIAFPEQVPIRETSPLIVVNGGEKGGGVTLMILTTIDVPAPTPVAIAVAITRKGTDLRAAAKVPVIAGGSGSLLGFEFRLGKTYEYKGKKVGYSKPNARTASSR